MQWLVVLLLSFPLVGSVEIITAGTCKNVRKVYPVRLDVMYEYTTVGEFQGVGRAIANAVATTMSACDDNGRPRRAALLSEATKHYVVSSGK